MKIAVIVPVCNGEKFLPEFLACLIRQTMKEFEVFFVDDCSTDQTETLLREVCSRQAGFHYLRNEIRCGAAVSRNRGIESSQSEYVICLDADDRIADDLLEQLEKAADSAQADMVMLERGDFVRAEAIDRKHVFLQDDAALYEYERAPGVCGKRVFAVREQPEDFLVRCQNGTCDRMIKRELLDRYRIRFQDLPSSNDVLYILFYTFAAETIVHTQTPDFLYYRRIHSQPGRISNDRDPMCAYEALRAVKDALGQYHMWKDCCVHFWMFALDSLEKQLFVCHSEERCRQVYTYLQKEGLRALGVPDDAMFGRLPEPYRREFFLLQTLPYGEKCFRNSMFFHALCEANLQRIGALFDYARKQNLWIGYWGVGRMTQGLVSAAERLGENIDYLIDNDRQKQGKRCSGIEIVSYDSVKENAGLIVISNKQYYREIFAQIKDGNPDMQVLSIQEYLYCDGEPEQYIR